MMRPTYFNKRLNKMVTKEYDFQDYVKPLYCACCDTTVYHNTFDIHNKSEYHKTAQYLRDNSTKPIENIKTAVIEYKMIKKYINKTILYNNIRRCALKGERWPYSPHARIHGNKTLCIYILQCIILYIYNTTYNPL